MGKCDFSLARDVGAAGSQSPAAQVAGGKGALGKSTDTGVAHIPTLMVMSLIFLERWACPPQPLQRQWVTAV